MAGPRDAQEAVLDDRLVSRVLEPILQGTEEEKQKFNKILKI